jgi:hypothetical protein
MIIIIPSNETRYYGILLNQCLLLSTKKTQQCHIWKQNSSFDLHKGTIKNEDGCMTKMAQSATMEGLWGDFITIKFG